MKVDLHNHTTLCNHADGSIDEYIEQAIKNKTEYFGFSDHAPMDFDEKYRMGFEDMKTYEKSIQIAKEKYSDQINILLGYEVDYIKGYVDKRVLNSDVDYLIGSVHFIDGWGFDNPEFIGEYENKDIDIIWQDYFNAIQDMVESGYFDIVGHLDLIKVFKFLPKKDIKLIAKDALIAVKKAEMVIELNVAGYRKPINEAYPSKELLQEAFNLGIDITFGSDAHKPEQVSMFNDKIISLAKSVGYTKCVIFKKRKKEYINI